MFATLGMHVTNLPTLSKRRSARASIGRTGGAVSLAVGMAQIFSGLPGHARPDGLLVPLRDHVRGAVHPDDDRRRHAGGALPGREFLGRAYAPFGAPRLDAGRDDLDAAGGACWGYFIWTGNISTIWPMFGIANQLLASVALAVGTTIIINVGRARYAWVTLLPLSFVSVTTLTAGVLSVRDNFWPMATGAERRAAPPGLSRHGADGRHDGVRAGDSLQRRVALGWRAPRTNCHRP